MDCINCFEFREKKCEGNVHYGTCDNCNDQCNGHWCNDFNCRGHDIATCINEECKGLLNCSDIDENGICRYCGEYSGFKSDNSKLIRTILHC